MESVFPGTAAIGQKKGGQGMTLSLARLKMMEEGFEAGL
jgi:hypothetical protein